MSDTPKFLSLDLVLKSATDLGPLVRALEQDDEVVILTHHAFAGEFTLIVELGHEGEPDAATLTRRFLVLIAGLPQAAFELWNGATRRSFDYGFEGGETRPAFEATIPAALLVQIGGLGADITFTVYPRQTS
ncbi:MAG: hypothetical protein FWD68_09720 [Alphaproteobacteria bacterium]|nr:hypothetical protein [Alphaproteobacteria bacterium]